MQWERVPCSASRGVWRTDFEEWGEDKGEEEPPRRWSALCTLVQFGDTKEEGEMECTVYTIVCRALPEGGRARSRVSSKVCGKSDKVTRCSLGHSIS